MIRRPPRSTLDRSSAASDVYKRQEFSDIGYVLVSGQTAIAGRGDDLLKNDDVGRLFLGG